MTATKDQRRAWEDHIAASWEAFRRYRAIQEGRDPEVRVKADDTIMDDWRAHETWRRAQGLPITLAEWLAAPVPVEPPPRAQKARKPRPIEPTLPERVLAYRAYRVVAHGLEGFESRWYADRRDAEWILALLARPAEQHHEEVELLDGSRWHSVIYWEPDEDERYGDELRIEEALIEFEPDLDVASGFAMYAERIEATC